MLPKNGLVLYNKPLLLATFVAVYLICSEKKCDLTSVRLTKVNTKFCSAELVLLFTPTVCPSPNTKKSCFGLSIWDDKLLSRPKITTFRPWSLSKRHKLSPSNTIP